MKSNTECSLTVVFICTGYKVSDGFIVSSIMIISIIIALATVTAPGEWNGHTLQYSCMAKPMDRGAWRATVHGVTKSRTRLSD